MTETTRVPINSNLVNRRQRMAAETNTNFYSTANQWFSRGAGEPEFTTVESVVDTNESEVDTTFHTNEPFSPHTRPTSVRFFDASSISTTKIDKENKSNTSPVDSSQASDALTIPREKAILLHKVHSSDTFAGLSLKYGIEVGILRRVNKLWSGDPQLRHEMKIPIVHCKITDAEIESLNARIISQEELESSEGPQKNTGSRPEIDSYSPRSSSSWSSSSSMIEDSRDMLEPLSSLVSRAVDSISKPLKYSHAWNAVNNAASTFRRSKKAFFISDHEEGPWIQMSSTDKLHHS
ncbi:hypothetical protein K7432_012446 [Basidiobolus ranarum]|uniref:LysM domain-containing protein n=1 Tax=Basidiobolus ranarum TaxID=34480 RepID=A0ABR2WKV5_9FUNG